MCWAQISAPFQFPFLILHFELFADGFVLFGFFQSYVFNGLLFKDVVYNFYQNVNQAIIQQDIESQIIKAKLIKTVKDLKQDKMILALIF